MIDELGPEARGLLEAARAGLSPDAGAVRRIHTKVIAASVAGGAAAGAALAIKLGALALVVAAGIGAGWALRHTRGAAPGTPALELATPVERPVRAASREPVGSVAVGSGSVGSVGLGSVDDELIVMEAPEVTPRVAAMRRRDPVDALRVVRQHAAETAARGQLAEDAAAIEVEAMCQLHDPTTFDKLEAFDARFPRSAQRSRLRSQCP